jgi:ABC-type antimicrobial peptide transport system permease subunit
MNTTNTKIKDTMLWTSAKREVKATPENRSPLATLLSPFVWLWSTITFMLLLIVYMINVGFNFIFHGRFIPASMRIRLSNTFDSIYFKIMYFLAPNKEGNISRVELMDLSFRNMQAKKSRTWVTIGGMTIGIGAIVFLVSIGYGLQEMVITRVARLEEMRQADVSPQTGGKVKLTNDTLSDFKDISAVQETLPLIAVVGSVSYKNSSSDMAVYGVTTEYLKQSAIQPIQGTYFDSNALSLATPSNVITTETSSGTAGSGTLGVSDSTTPINNTDKSVDWVSIPSEANTVAVPGVKTVELSPNAKKEAVVSTAMLQVLGINQADAVGTVFNTSFIVVGELLPDQKERLESKLAEYKIVGVISDDKTPLFYVPFADLKSLGITNYSQVKVMVDDTNNLPTVRKQIESMGYVTRSVTDTVAQINTLFESIRTILALLGMVALAVAALGMFNTLTVSLLERTREVGLMKAMGMRSTEVRELFLTESMIMGFFGGVLGTLLGWIAGKLLGVILSFVTLSKGVGIVDVSSIPIPFILLVLGLSFVVGIVTGIYPARRATKISALNALRYE